nr:putative ribonuclease H-like domain-containing protein [Tanacetum cinerariifolium]
MYCLVVTNDYSRFTWVFFLDTKDENCGIIKSFITRIENLVDHNVKVIRCDNETEFKNREMNQFCEMKGILRQFSVAKTPQQNRVAEKRNKTLIEAAKTMLADSNKAFRAFNSRTRIVVENLHIRFSESTSNVVGSGPNWLFDIDTLTRTMNYEPIVVGIQSNGFADPKSSNDDGSKPSSDYGKKVDEDPIKENECNDQEKEDNVNNTNNVKTFSSTVNNASTNGVNADAVRKLGPTPESDLRRYRVEQTGYGITDTWDEIVDTLMEIALITLEGVNQRVIELDTTVRQRTDEFEVRFEEAQDVQDLMRARVNTLFRDRPDHRRIAMLLDREAMYARKAWASFKDRSAAIVAHVLCPNTRGTSCCIDCLYFITSDSVDYSTWTYRDTRG